MVKVYNTDYLYYLLFILFLFILEFYKKQSEQKWGYSG